MGRRTLLLVAALIVAALGTTLVFAYVKRADDRALKDQAPVKVLVAKSTIKAGTSVEQAENQALFSLQDIPQSAAVAGHLKDTRSIADLVAVADIFAGEQILPQKFARVGSTTGLPIPPGKLATSVQLGDPQRVAGFVQPGSEIAVFVTISGAPAATGGAGAAATGLVTRLLLPRVSVVAVGPTTLRPAENGQGNKEALPTAILSLALDQAQAQKLIFATENGRVWFSLLTKESKVAPGPGTDIHNLFS
jgi:pilus assembly protein CpaB